MSKVFAYLMKRDAIDAFKARLQQEAAAQAEIDAAEQAEKREIARRWHG